MEMNIKKYKNRGMKLVRSQNKIAQILIVININNKIVKGLHLVHINIVKININNTKNKGQKLVWIVKTK